METDINLTSKPPDNNLVWAIVSTVLCCWPLGVVSIIKSAKVNTLWAQGDYEGAQKSADDAKKWAIYSGIGAAVFSVIIIIIAIVLGIASNEF
jgi:hypothetical protein